jgi:hypothetical protein
MRGCLLLVLGIVVGALLVVAVQALVLTPPPLPQDASINPDLVIRFSNQFLTRELQTQLSQTQSAVSLPGLTVQAEEGQRIVLVGTPVVTGISTKVPLRVTLRPSVAQNRVSVQIVQADVGTLKLPGSLFTSVETTINQELNRALANQQYRIVGVGTTVDGVLVDVSLNR